MKKTILFVFCAVISIFIFGCQTTRKDEIPSIKLNEIEPMKIGDTVQLTVELKFFEGNVNFQSNDESIVIVNDSGVVTAIDCGQSTVIASIEKDGKKYSDSIEIEVLKNEPVKPSHEHEKCSECGKCISEDCDGEEQDKCQGHEPVKPNTQENNQEETGGE
jgi:ribosomal protein L19